MSRRPTRTGSKRRYGSGSLQRRGNSWIGVWRSDGRQIKRTLGRIRLQGSRQGLTEKQAEKRLHEVMASFEPPRGEAVGFTDVANHHIDRIERLGRKKATIEDYRSHLRIHFEPAFGNRDIRSIDRRELERFRDRKLKEPSRATGKPLARKSVRNLLSILHGVFQHAVREEWLPDNPMKFVEKPEEEEGRDIKFLTLEELDRLIDAVPDDGLGRLEKVLYEFAAYTGLRQGELMGLRWRDIDWTAWKVRVRMNFVRGEHSTPKSVRGSRSVPLAENIAVKLEAHFQQSRWQEDNHLVFCHPDTGRPYDRSKLLKRFKSAVAAANVGEFETKLRWRGTGKNRRQIEAEVPVFTFHGLRHTFGTRMAAAGVPIRTIQEWMGHRDYKTTLIYADYSPGEQEAQMVNRAFSRVTRTPEEVVTSWSQTDGESPGQTGTTQDRPRSSERSST